MNWGQLGVRESDAKCLPKTRGKRAEFSGPLSQEKFRILMCPRCITIYDRKVSEMFERVPFAQGWTHRSGNPANFTFDKRGVPRRLVIPLSKMIQRVTFKLPTNVPTDRWIKSSANIGKGKQRSFS